MKKHALLLLSMLLTLSLAACGNDAPADETEVDQLPEQEITETVGNAEETAAQTEAQTEPESEPAAEAQTEPVVNAGWAGAEYEMPVPEVPFAWEVKGDGSCITVTSVNGGEGGDVTHEAILRYCDLLKSVGFTENLQANELGERYGRICYQFSAKNADGCYVELIDDGGGVMLVISLPAES
ncbi:MAG: hypothetical protein E7658_09995 [Ruminococcaceae bacterium]|nr:hypothetical protein [Oscillospiraceae bacterium]